MTLHKVRVYLQIYIQGETRQVCTQVYYIRAISREQATKKAEAKYLKEVPHFYMGSDYPERLQVVS